MGKEFQSVPKSSSPHSFLLLLYLLWRLLRWSVQRAKWYQTASCAAAEVSGTEPSTHMYKHARYHWAPDGESVFEKAMVSSFISFLFSWWSVELGNILISFFKRRMHKPYAFEVLFFRNVFLAKHLTYMWHKFRLISVWRWQICVSCFRSFFANSYESW